jgi:co-chaperonin GroES (HSP10)
MLKKVLGKNVLVDPDPLITTTPSGLIVPKVGAKAQRSGTVVLVGNDCDPNINKGDHVYFKVYSGNTLKIDGKEYMMFIESNILAKDEK